MILGHPYIKGTLDKIGVTAEIGKRKGYKVPLQHPHLHVLSLTTP